MPRNYKPKPKTIPVKYETGFINRLDGRTEIVKALQRSSAGSRAAKSFNCQSSCTLPNLHTIPSTSINRSRRNALGFDAYSWNVEVLSPIIATTSDSSFLLWPRTLLARLSRHSFLCIGCRYCRRTYREAQHPCTQLHRWSPKSVGPWSCGNACSIA